VQSGNIAGLLLARGRAPTGDGDSDGSRARLRLIGHLLTESILLA
jgi:hypothetical protein